jgi:hypothetical protein
MVFGGGIHTREFARGADAEAAGIMSFEAASIVMDKDPRVGAMIPGRAA